MYFFYIARCSDDSLYAGICTDIKSRQTKHNDGRGAKYTRSRRPIEIIYYEEHLSRSEALKREAEVKRWPRERKLLLINSALKRHIA